MTRRQAKITSAGIAATVLGLALAGCTDRYADDGSTRTYYSDSRPTYYNEPNDFSSESQYRGEVTYYTPPAPVPVPPPGYVAGPPPRYYQNGYAPPGYYYYPAPTYRDANGYYRSGYTTDYYYRPADTRR